MWKYVRRNSPSVIACMPDLFLHADHLGDRAGPRRRAARRHRSACARTARAPRADSAAAGNCRRDRRETAIMGSSISINQLLTRSFFIRSPRSGVRAPAPPNVGRSTAPRLHFDRNVVRASANSTGASIARGTRWYSRRAISRYRGMPDDDEQRSAQPARDFAHEHAADHRVHHHGVSERAGWVRPARDQLRDARNHEGVPAFQPSVGLGAGARRWICGAWRSGRSCSAAWPTTSAGAARS